MVLSELVVKGGPASAVVRREAPVLIHQDVRLVLQHPMVAEEGLVLGSWWVVVQ